MKNIHYPSVMVRIMGLAFLFESILILFFGFSFDMRIMVFFFTIFPLIFSPILDLLADIRASRTKWSIRFCFIITIIFALLFYSWVPLSSDDVKLVIILIWISIPATLFIFSYFIPFGKATSKQYNYYKLRITEEITKPKDADSLWEYIFDLHNYRGCIDKDQTLDILSIFNTRSDSLGPAAQKMYQLVIDGAYWEDYYDDLDEDAS